MALLDFQKMRVENKFLMFKIKPLAYGSPGFWGSGNT